MYAEGQIQTRILGHKNNYFPVEFCSKYSGRLDSNPLYNRSASPQNV